MYHMHMINGIENGAPLIAFKIRRPDSQTPRTVSIRTSAESLEIFTISIFDEIVAVMITAYQITRPMQLVYTLQ